MRSAVLRGLPLLAAVFSVNTATAERPLTPHVAEYKVKVSVLSGKLMTEVQPTDGGYAAQSILRAAGIARMFVRGDVTEHATFEIVDDSVRPLAYNSSDQISKEDKFMQFRFDWDEDLVSGSINEQPIQMELDGRVFDRVSLQYVLMLDLLNDRKNDEYALLDDEELKVLQVTHLGEKEIRVPFGRFDAVGVQHRKANSKSDRVTTLWCVEKLDFLPVLIEQHRDGKLAMRAVLTEYTPSAVHARL